MPYSDKPKKRKRLPHQRPSVVIIEALIVLVAIGIAGYFFFDLTKSDPEIDTHALYSEADLYLELKDYPAAIKLFTDAIIAGYEPVSEAYSRRGRANYQLLNLQAAVNDFTLSIENTAECGCSYEYYYRGLSYELMGAYQAAIDDYTLVIEQDSDNHTAYLHRAQAYYQTGDRRSALNDTQRGLRLSRIGQIDRPMSLDKPLEGRLATPGQQYFVTFAAQAGEKITLTTPDSTFPILLLLMDSDETPLAFAPSGIADKSAIDSFTVTEDGDYTVILAAYDGESTGEFHLALEVKSPLIDTTTATRITAENASYLVEVQQLNRIGGNLSAWSPDGRLFLENAYNSGILLYDMTLASPRHHQVVNFNKSFSALVMSADYQTLALGDSQHILLYDVETGERRAVLRGNKAHVVSMALNADASLLAANGSYQTVKVWNTDTGEIVYRLKSDVSMTKVVTFSSDSRWLAGGGLDGKVAIWHVQTGNLMQTYAAQSDDAITSLTFSPNNDVLLAGTERGSLMAWNTSSGALIAEYKAHRGEIYQVVFSPDGQLIASAGKDGEIRLWSLEKDTPIATLQAKGVNNLIFRDDGRMLLSAGTDKFIRLWQVK